MALKATEAIEELERLVHEFGDAVLVMPDPIEATFQNPVDRIEFDTAQQAILFVSDRLQPQAGTAVSPGRIRDMRPLRRAFPVDPVHTGEPKCRESQ